MRSDVRLVQRRRVQDGVRAGQALARDVAVGDRPHHRGARRCLDVDPGHVVAASRELDRVSPLAAGQVEDAPRGVEVQQGLDLIDFDRGPLGKRGVIQREITGPKPAPPPVRRCLSHTFIYRCPMGEPHRHPDRLWRNPEPKRVYDVVTVRRGHESPHDPRSGVLRAARDRR